MKFLCSKTVAAIGGLLQLALASPAIKRDVVTVLDVDTVTVIETVTFGASPSSGPAVAAPVHSLHYHHHHQHGSSSAPAASTYSSETASLATSIAPSGSHTISSSRVSSLRTSAISTSAPVSSSSPPATSSGTSLSLAAPSGSPKRPASPSISTSASTHSVASTSAAPLPTTIAQGTTYTPGKTKAGLSGFVNIQDQIGFSQLAPYISWYSDYTAVTPDSGSVKGVGMLWGNKTSCNSTPDLASRFDAFTAMTATATPSVFFGMYEPDCNCPDSSDISDPVVGAAEWNTYIAPLAAKGTVLGSPSMCKQYDEDWLTPFNASIQTTWDITAVHINKINVTGAQLDIEYYWNKYQRPIWVAEFACVDDHDGFTPSEDQDTVNQYINDCVAYFESNEHVVAYGPSNGAVLGSTWPLFDNSGDLTASGTTYLNAIKGL